MQRKILVLGNGYLGFHIAKAFADDAKVTVYSLPTYYDEHLPKNVSLVKGTIADTAAVAKLMTPETTIIYSIGTINATNDSSSMIFDLEQHYIPFLRLLDAATEAQVQRFIFLSSAGTVYGNVTSDVVKETQALSPINVYGLQKVFFESVLRIKALESENKLPYLVLRVSNPYGGRLEPNRKQGIIPTLLEKCLLGQPVKLWAAPETIRDYIYIDDFLEIVRRLLNLKDPDILEFTINVGSGVGTSLKELIEVVERTTGRKVIIEQTAIQVQNISRNVLDIARLQGILGEIAFTPITSGLSKLYSSRLTRC